MLVALVAHVILPTIAVLQSKSYPKVNVGKTCDEMEFLDADKTSVKTVSSENNNYNCVEVPKVYVDDESLIGFKTS